METVRYRPRRRSGGWLKWLVIACGLSAMLAVIWFGWQRFEPNNTIVEPDYGEDYPLLYHGQVIPKGALVDGEQVRIPISFIQDQLGLKEEVYYESKTGSIVLTTSNKVLRMQTNTLTAKLNKSPYQLRIAAEVVDKTAYIPTQPLQELFGLQVSYNPSNHIVTVLSAGDAIQLGAKKKGELTIRRGPSMKEPIYERIAASKEVRIWGEQEKWYVVQSADGIVGYADKSSVALTKMEQIKPLKDAPVYPAWKAVGSKINLTWEAVYMKAPNPDVINNLTGVNVVSPTWFALVDGNGSIQSKADKAYVDRAHKLNMQVWAVFSNSFDPDLTTKALASAESRLKMIQQLAALAQMYKLQGINLDFENVYTADKANLVQFVRELTPYMHEMGVVVSIDVTPKSNSEMWSLFLDRAALGKVVDYMMVMAYDEHWAASPISGSVASLPWTEQSIKKILTEDGVPPGKLVLGMPLYTRQWTEKKDKEGKTVVTSKTLGMEAVQKLIAQRGLKQVIDAESGQRYVEYTADGALQRIWIEDSLSMKARVALVKKYNLAGAATWQRQFQSDDIWGIIHQSLTKLP
ncbi:glycosyl hydrolase family 18 protein [Paenibacillus sacheonensis]|uniref:Glycosyl hydrolase n=1 Tax=Paenibacillus sacheonensis TaxID=742054 RepID=A0A7X5C149_9BACL|nr:spore germination protein YaaH [Paenibacillus sacheonensis]NBC69915.1 glycosyl hydrolase [Paenibacillus sacheonensis]